MIDANKLADLIDEATESRKVCVPPEWYDDSPKDFYTETIYYINAGRLAELLRESSKDKNDKEVFE